MAGVFAPTQTDYVAYLAYYNALPGYKAPVFADRVIRYVCWAIENSVALSSEEFAEWLLQASLETAGTNGVATNLSPSSDTLG